MKRAIDFLFASIGLIALSIPLACLMLIIRMKLGSPIFFKQIRPGLNAKPFKMVKFRTMTDQRDSDGVLLPDALRLTRFGRLLRSTSIDELPELWNVLKGDMSLVGPRPLLMQYLPRYSKKQARRHEVRPGITGWAQINGRNTLSWEQKFELDVWYVDNYNLCLDIRIIATTVLKVILRESINSKTSSTMDEFFGDKKNES
jgi:lipopolysaccharide/colanic/teichoic acid biosynthesis glycosyltransferase